MLREGGEDEGQAIRLYTALTVPVASFQGPVIPAVLADPNRTSLPLPALPTLPHTPLMHLRRKNITDIVFDHILSEKKLPFRKHGRPFAPLQHLKGSRTVIKLT